LPVALHSPLEVLRDQLANYTGISRGDQVRAKFVFFSSLFAPPPPFARLLPALCFFLTFKALLIYRTTSLQFLILCDLTDPDRNHDVSLQGKDFMSLRECGIRNGSTLTIHPVGMVRELRSAMAASFGSALGSRLHSALRSP
jgi:hypothetical protein